MKITFLGTGSAFTLGANNYHSNMLIQNEMGDNLLIDCGTDARFSLHEQGLSYKDITDIYISHLHADHAGGLEWLAQETKFDENCDKPTLYISELLVDELWAKISVGLSSLQGVEVTLDTFFHVIKIPLNGSFMWQGVLFQLVQTVHVMNAFALVPSFGLLFELNQTKIFITCDTQLCPNQISDFYKRADIIFHDCETAQKRSGVHAHYQDLIHLDNAIKAKMWLYHYNPGSLPDAEQKGFCGFVKKGQTFIF